MNTRQLFFSAVAVVMTIPMTTLAQRAADGGLVPCGDRNDTGFESMCQMCHAVQLVNNVNAWLVGVLSVAASIMFVLAGYRILTAGGNQSVLKSAKSMIINVAVGFAIVLGAWLLIDFMMKALLTDGPSPLGPWNAISCVDQPEYADLPAFVGFPTSDRSRGTAYDTGSTFDPAAMGAVAGLSAPDAAVAAAAAAAGLDADQTRNLQALMRVESGGCRNLESPVGALGCMQIMPNTAKQYDPSLRGLSDTQVRARLLEQDYNINLGARIYADLYNEFDGDETKVFAGYNGGPGALRPSSDCPGGDVARYQCVWDSPGCYGTTRTDCVPNTGYQETRDYVKKVAAVAERLP